MLDVMFLHRASYLLHCCDETPNRSNLGKNKFIFVPSPRVQAAIIARKAEQLEIGAAGHTTSAVRKQREMNTVLNALALC